MDTLGTILKYPDYQGVLIFQITLYDSVTVGAISYFEIETHNWMFHVSL